LASAGFDGTLRLWDVATGDILHVLGSYVVVDSVAFSPDGAALAAAFIEGARAQGADVVDYGLIGTDMLYYAVARDGHDGGAQITASHNPKQYNGMKLVGAQAIPLSGDKGISDILTAPPAPPPPGNSWWAHNARSRMSGIFSSMSMSAFKVSMPGAAWPARGTPSSRACRTTAVFRLTAPSHPRGQPLIEEIPRHHRKVIEIAAIGIAWDGDADRCFFLDGTGEFIAGDFITALLAESFLMKRPGSTIIYDVRASYAVKEIVAQYGGRALMNRVGHAFIKARMREEDAIFGGEVTGHYYFRDNFYADNGFIPALLILELMSKKGLSLRDLLKPLRERYFISGEINTKVPSMDVVPQKIAALRREYAHGHVYELDGISVEFDDWHFNVRASNTEPLLRLNLEGTTPETMEKRRDEVLSIIRG
jgi:phosphomannomutase